MGWMIDVEGAQFREEEVTGAHLTMVNTYLGKSDWGAVDPMSSPEVLMMWAAIAVAQNTKKPLDEALMFIQMMPLAALLACYVAEAPPAATEPVPAAPGATQRPLVAPWPTG